LRCNGWLEIGVGLLALLVAVAVAGIEHLYVALHPHPALVVLSLVRLVLVQGAVRADCPHGRHAAGARRAARAARVTGEAPELHRDLARLYGVNTLGAVAGTALAGLSSWDDRAVTDTWPPRRSTSASVPGVRWGTTRRATTRGRRARRRRNARDGGGGSAPARALLLYAGLAFAISGGVSLTYEVAWTRVLAQIIGSSTYAFTSILGAFLLGIGLGSFALARWRGRDTAGLWGFCFAELGIGATAALVVPLLVRLPEVQLRAFEHLHGLGGVLLLQFGLCLAAVLLPTIAMGATFPLVAGFVAGRAGDIGRAVGRLYAGNTLGGIVGSMLAAFVLLPHWGTQRTLLVALSTNVRWRSWIGAARGVRRGRRSQPAAPAQGSGRGHSCSWRSRSARRGIWYGSIGIAIGGPATVHGDPTLRLRDINRGLTSCTTARD
jgi:spermidine synthase